MKKSLNICFLMIFSIFQIACGHSYGLRVKGTSFFTNAEDPRIDLLLLTQYSLPGMDEAGARSSHIFIERDTNGREIIQQDNYGRECCLFEFKVPNQCYGGVPGGDNVHSALVVLQAHKDNKIYFYEDYCFRVIPSDGLSDLEKAEFLARNDWNEPIQEGKMSSRTDSLSTNIITSDDSLFDIIDMAFPNRVLFDHLMQDDNGNWLIWITEQEGYSEWQAKIKENLEEKDQQMDDYPLQEKSFIEMANSCIQKESEKQDEKYKTWIVIWPSSSENFDFEKDAMLVGTLDFGPALHEFKIAHGWVFE